MDHIHHVAQQVRDIARTADWHRKQLSCEVGYQDKTWALLTFDNLTVDLVTPGQHPPHIGVERADAARFGSLKPHRGRTALVYIHGSSGNTLEVLARQTLKEPA